MRMMKKQLTILLLLAPLFLMGQNYMLKSQGRIVYFQGSYATYIYNIPNLYITDSVITGNNATMNGANDWVTGIGGLVPDMVTTPGVMTLDLSLLGNKAVKLDNGDLTGVKDARIYVRARRIAGDEMSLHIGRRFASTVDNDSDFEFTPDTAWSEYIVTMRGTSSDVFWIGAPSAYNQGSTFEIDHCAIFEVDTIVEENEQSTFALIPKAVNGGNMIDNIKASTKTLTKVGFVGNSIMANNYGGEIPALIDEGATERPPRLTVRNVPRRIYDTLFSVTTGFNKAIYKRADNVDWSYTGTWTDTTGDPLILSPVYTTEIVKTNYTYTSTSGATAEIVIPDGYENAALIYHKAKNYYGANYDDSVFVSLNGGSIASYGDIVFSTFRNTSISFPDDIYHVNEYNNLPSGANTITLTKDDDSENFVLWGAAYWTGKTIMVLNYARGGNSNQTLWTTGLRENQRLTEDLYYRDFDFMFYEMPGMNHAGDSDALEYQQAFYENILNTFKNVPSVLVTTHPFGCSDGSCTINYYTLYNSPVDLERRYNRSYNYSYYDGYESYNIFRDFKPIYEQYGTLESGEGAKTYTTDGQHPNILCAEKWIELLMKNILK